MQKTDNTLTSDTQICKDKMRLAVSNVSPTFQKESEQETWQEIEILLYRIFKKYA